MKAIELSRRSGRINRWGRILLAVVFVLVLFPASFPPQLAWAFAPPYQPPLQELEPEGVWRLVNTDQSQKWQGDNFHGLKSEYNAFFNGDSIGAVYTQYNIRFNDKQPVTIASSLTGTCAWAWDGGSIPSEIKPGTAYPFVMSADAAYYGSNLLGATTTGFTCTKEGGDIASAQAYLDINGLVLSDHQESRGSLALNPGATEGETKTVTLICRIDIVTVTQTYTYQWAGSGCSAKVTLPKNMQPDEPFTPTVVVVDKDKRPIAPQQENWFYNDAPSAQTMTWDGKAATVKYEYVCPNEDKTRTTTVAIPAAKFCKASLALPEKMTPDEMFSPRANVVDQDGNEVAPENVYWFYNGASSSVPMKWKDGAEAVVRFDYTCPLNRKKGTASITVPPAKNDNAWVVVVGDWFKVLAAGLVAVGGGGLAVRRGSKKEAGPKYILQLTTRTVELKVKKQGPLMALAWKIMPDGTVEPASDAVIRVAILDQGAGVAVTPASGICSQNFIFTLTDPQVCKEVPVSVTASIKGYKTSDRVTVKILPTYELNLAWHDPQKTILMEGANEIYAAATLKATPLPDAATTPDKLAKRILVSKYGPNSDLVLLKAAPPKVYDPFVRDGKLWIPLRMENTGGASFRPGNPTLKAAFEDKDDKLSQELALTLKPLAVFDARVEGKKKADVLFDGNQESPTWVFPDIIAYFHDPGNDAAAVEPTFDYGKRIDQVIFDPPVLMVNEISPNGMDQYTIGVQLKPGANLEDSFGVDLSERNGIIQVRVSVKIASGKPLDALVTYQLRPQFSLFAYQEVDEPRLVKGIPLKSVEFLADGEDLITVKFGCCRSDITGDVQAKIARKLPDVHFTVDQFELMGDRSDYFEAYKEDVWYEQNAPICHIRSKSPVLYDADIARSKVFLQAQGSLNEDVPPNYLGREIKLDRKMEVFPRLPNLKLWVVPGKSRGTSEAWMLAYLEDTPDKRIKETSLLVKTDSLGSPKLEILGRYDQEEVRTGDDGSAQVDLRYAGMDWDNYQEALFTVSAYFSTKNAERLSKPVQEAINIKKNVKQLLGDLFDRADMLKLNNPYYETRSYGLSSIIDLTVYRPFVRGPIWNMCCSISGNDGAALVGDKTVRFARDYSCSEMRDRIASWMTRRRHYLPGDPRRIGKVCMMNGIEFDNFDIGGGLHRYAAIFLSGMAPTKDPRGLDPWWKQHWKDEAYKTVDGLLSNFWQQTYCAEAAAWYQVSLIPLQAIGFATGGGVLIAMTALIPPLAGLYAVATVGELCSRSVYSGKAYHTINAHDYTPRETFIEEWAAWASDKDAAANDEDEAKNTDLEEIDSTGTPKTFSDNGVSSDSESFVDPATKPQL